MHSFSPALTCYLLCRQAFLRLRHPRLTSVVFLSALLLLLPFTSCKSGGAGEDEAADTTHLLPGDTLIPRGFTRAVLHIDDGTYSLNLVCLPEDIDYDNVYGQLGRKQGGDSDNYSWLKKGEGTPTELRGSWWQQGSGQDSKHVAGLCVERSGNVSMELISDLYISIHGREDMPESTDDTIILRGEVISGTLHPSEDEAPRSLSGASVRLTYTIATQYLTPEFHYSPRTATTQE